MKKDNFKKTDLFILSFILITAFIFRLYKINIPLADLHSWRQADTAAVARNFVNKGFDLLHPLYDDLSNVQSGLDNPQGYRMVEFPIYNIIFAYLYKLWPIFSLEVWGRLVSMFFSLIIIAVIYYLTLKEVNRLAAFFASIIYAVFPFFVFFSRVILPETTALGFAFLSIFFLYLFSQKTNHYSLITIHYFLSLIFLSISLLIKPTVIFYGITLLYLFYLKFKKKTLKNPFFYFYFFIAFLPLLLWRLYIKNCPQGIPVSEWLITSVNTASGLQKIFFRPAFFRWIFFERINNLIFGGCLTVFFILGVFLKQKKFLLFNILIAAFVYLFVFQGGNVQHEYYQTLILPALAIFSGIGASYLLKNPKQFLQPAISSLFIVFIFAFSWFFSFYQVRDYYSYSTDLVQMAKIISSLTDKEDKVVTDRQGDTTLLYLAERRGAPAIYKNPGELKKLGYKYLVTNNSQMIDKMKTSFYPLIFSNDKFSIFSL